MFFSLYWFVIFLLEVVKLDIVIFKLSEYKVKRRILPVVISSVLVEVIILLAFFLNDESPYMAYLIGSIAIFIIVGWAGEKIRVIYFVISYLSICILDMIFCGILVFILGIDTQTLSASYFLSLIGNSLSIPFLILMVFVKEKFRLKIRGMISHIKLRYYILALIGIAGCGIYVAPIQIFGLAEKGSYVKKVVALGFSISGILFIIVAVTLVLINDSKKYYRELYEMNQKLIKQQKQYYETLMEKENNTKKFRHDINNHIYCLKYLCEKKNYEALSSYLKEMQTSIEGLRMNIQTGNEIVNIVVNDIVQRNTREDIEFHWKGLLPEKIKISSMDLCTIFSNLFMNAVEAVRQLETSEIKIINTQIKMSGSSIIITMENPAVKKVNVVGGCLATTKSNAKQHGFGSVNVAACVKKYNGSIDYDSTDSHFLVEIIFENVSQ